MKRTFLVPEVVQTSAMDCGPAALKALLEGHGVNASYGRLREACQTDVDGTSIDTIEQAAQALGLNAAQVMAPVDHLPIDEAGLLPALVVVRQPNGSAHFVVVWRRHGRWIQLMDPAVGRRFVSIEKFQSEIYRHTMPVPADAWCDFTSSREWRKALDRRMKSLGCLPRQRNALLNGSSATDSWLPSARLDAAIRMTESLVRTGGIARGRTTGELIDKLSGGDSLLPDRYWTVRADPAGEATLLLSGAVMITVAGMTSGGGGTPVSPELAAALAEPPEQPLREILRFLRMDGVSLPALLLPALGFAAAGVAAEALLLRGLLDLSGELRLSGQRFAGLAAILALFLLLLILEWPIEGGILRMGRKLEGRLRLAFIRKIPLLSDRYFQSRLMSDMAERCHTLQSVRALPEVAGAFLRASFEMALTTFGIAWLYPESALLALGIAIVSTAIPLLSQPALSARDLRWRTHAGALSRFYLDAMQGLVAIRAHGAEQALRREQKGLLAQWAAAGLALQKTIVTAGGLQFAAGLGFAAWLLLRHIGSGGDLAGVLLLAYWTLNLPMLGQAIGAAVCQYPGIRNTVLRLLEPLGALEEPLATARPNQPGRPGVAVHLDSVTVRAAGNVVLDNISLSVNPSEHIGIVGSSGAGKSSLVGLLLGWHKPAQGSLSIDGQPLEAATLSTLREHTAWVDPQVRLWNRSLFDNLRYGSEDSPMEPCEHAIETSGLRGVLRNLPDGLQSVLGEGGALLSGGQGQRVRFGRALARRGVRLVILDEPARGLDRSQRQSLLGQARGSWPDATMLCITHDVGETLDFPRVLVMDHGRIVEDGDPRQLAADPGSRYRALLDAESLVRKRMWSSGLWRRIQIDSGRIAEQSHPKGELCAR